MPRALSQFVTMQQHARTNPPAAWLCHSGGGHGLARAALTSRNFGSRGLQGRQRFQHPLPVGLAPLAIERVAQVAELARRARAAAAPVHEIARNMIPVT
eukprot:CAMPEP_0198589106 /NCGR_PEP_ID=MMETSP1462-20131121/133954_1 /TAXON_ID=1333877 /ORGANISM="Brandtodinium nutriculum, Strain RCC3387" /LENGTH=98 /DNA_ID=CAMNT_0044320617 /DNA_START=77 /DNA_END=369 /DNA_ORIENTATION=-